jgi:hypothetical protein
MFTSLYSAISCRHQLAFSELRHQLTCSKAVLGCSIHVDCNFSDVSEICFLAFCQNVESNTFLYFKIVSSSLYRFVTVFVYFIVYLIRKYTILLHFKKLRIVK